MAAEIFINYRREDAASEAGRIYDTLKAELGQECVFMDRSSIKPGMKWPKRISEALESSSIVIVVIGPSWLKISNKWGERRIDEPEDWVRKEIENAIVLSKKIIPVLVNEGFLAPPGKLPSVISGLTDNQAAHIRPETWDQDLYNFIAEIKQFLPFSQKDNLRLFYSKSEESSRQNKIDDDSIELYADLLLRSCDVLDLGALPNRYQNLDSNQLTLRNLYIPLRFSISMNSRKKTEGKIADLDSNNATEVGGTGSTSQSEQCIGKILESNKRIIILGNPGSGKSTLTRWLTSALLLKKKGNLDEKSFPDFESLPQVNWIPILVRCSKLPQDGNPRSLEDILKYSLRMEEVREDLVGEIYAFLRKKLETGNALLMVDGLDELSSSNLRTSFAQQIQTFATSYPEAPIIVTSRIVGYREMNYRLDRTFVHAEITSISEKDKIDFVVRWFNATELEEKKEAAAQDLVKAILNSPSVERITDNPLQLTIVALVEKLSKRREELYGECVKTLLNWRSETDEPIEWREAVPQLAYVAHYMQKMGLTRLDFEKAIELIETARNEHSTLAIQTRDPESFLRAIERRTSLILERGSIKKGGIYVPLYEFRHLTFQEYFAGLSLIIGRYPGCKLNTSVSERIAPLLQENEVENYEINSRIKVNETLISSKWYEPLKICISACTSSDAEEALLSIIDREKVENDNNKLRARALLAASCLADEPDISLDIGLEVLENLLNQVNENDGYNNEANTGLDKAILKLIKSEGWQVYTINALLQKYLSITDFQRTHIGSLYMFAEAFHPTAKNKPELEFVLKDLEDNDELKIVRSFLSITNLLYSRYDEIKKDLDVLRISNLIFEKIHTSPAAASAAIWALNWLAYREKERDSILKISSSQLSYLHSIISDSNSPKDTVKYSLLSLECIYNRSLRNDYLFRWAEMADGHKYIEIDIEDLKKTSNPIVEIIHPWIYNDLPKIRKTAALALARIGVRSEDLVDVLFEIFTDSKSVFRRRKDALIFMAIIGGDNAVKLLSTCLESEDVVLRNYATVALFGLRGRSDMKSLETIVNRNIGKAREYAALVLGRKDIPLTDKYDFKTRLIRYDDTPIHLVRGKDSTTMPCYFFLLCTHSKLDQLLEKSKKSNTDLTAYGEVIASGYGSDVSDEVRALLKEKYNFDADTLTRLGD